MANCPLNVAFTQNGVARLLWCGKWSCPNCRAQLASKWARIAKYGVHKLEAQHGGSLFWTFTLGSGYTTVSEGYKALPRLWDNTRKYIERDQGKFLYLAFVEGQPHRNNMPHFHAIVFAHIPYEYNSRTDPRENIKDFAVARGFGHQAKEKLVSSSGAAKYVSDYANKGTPDIPVGFHRARCATKWPRPPEKKHPPYVVRARAEPIDEFLIRVQEASNRSLDDILADYQSAVHEMMYVRSLTL